MSEPKVTIQPTPLVVIISAGAPVGVKGISRTIVIPPVQSPKVQIGGR